MSPLRTVEVAFTTPFALACFIAAYVLVGVLCWNHLNEHVETVEEAELAASSRFTLWGRIGKALLILSWPLWTIVASAIYAVIRPFRGVARHSLKAFPGA